ncbi:MAG: helix-turn-helix domain-containing protein [Putridiphycobacter sp.]|nr:helix-turn-helix domain-containing protein [Putridiphycobacter sp.]
MKDLMTLSTISQIHAALGLEKPTHPLVSVVPQNALKTSAFPAGTRVRVDLYQIWMKQGVDCQMGYGRNTYDFEEGTLAFMKPGQVILAPEENAQQHTAEGYLLMFHPDLIRKSPLGDLIYQFSFFNYEVHEALHISENEKETLYDIVHKIQIEIGQNIDKHSQSLIVSNLELLLGYCTRYYDRQFYTRTNLNQEFITKFDGVLKAYYTSNRHLELGLPSVAYCAESLSMSPNYLGDLVKKETGSTAQDYIQGFIINRAKNKLLGTSVSLSEIAYSLGFEYPQHFSKVFKKKTGQTPTAFRQLN